MELIAGAPGYGPAEGKCLPCSGVSRTIVNVSPRSAFIDQYKSTSQVQFGSLRLSSRRAIVCCKSSSAGSRRNPDFPRHNKHGFSSGRNRPMEERESFDILDESDSFPSKNGPVLSIPSSPKSQATAVPGPREKEIVELFRKVQAQLRERAAVKEEKKSQDATKGPGKESETVDSLLKLLRKHSVEQSKRKTTGTTIRNLNTEQTEQQPSSSYEERGLSYFDSGNSVRDAARVPNNNASFSRPVSNFRRKSPVPRMKYPPINLETERNRSRVEMHPEPEDESELEPEPEPEAELEQFEEEPEAVISDEAVYHDMSGGNDLEPDESGNSENGEEQDQLGTEDLTGLKVVELRALAKSRGMKGFSKMKKEELLELLSESSA
ncbi:rho-N domain-containing protein 1, chloroplastic [Punica granatum]|uniref:Rho termination factor-like N-terminal domain-containing protein n=2 Tax=Punica granatum TaxID=22663 RepID=A0A218X9Q1_PUNGR|nr:rho-N domain-containing protein 1, chloroplastic [Punica granatum]OWM81498.1 hypothetical protein CDL15_Pgr007536 [Punica granatum]PKI41136.1 hypothetical protein CRG98_038664 [Punica granatum]